MVGIMHQDGARREWFSGRIRTAEGCVAARIVEPEVTTLDAR